MLKIIGVLIILLNLGTGEKFPGLGDVWTGPVAEKRQLYLPPPNDFKQAITFSHNNIDFTGGISKEKKILFISTNNPAFKIKGASYIGRPFSGFKDRKAIKSIPGWGHYLYIDDGWYALFHYGDIDDASKCLSVFRYHF